MVAGILLEIAAIIDLVNNGIVVRENAQTKADVAKVKMYAYEKAYKSGKITKEENDKVQSEAKADIAKYEEIKKMGRFDLAVENTKDQFKRMFSGITHMVGEKTKETSMHSGIGGGGAVTDAAINTSMLSGASGGLGEAKIIHMHFNKALVENNIPGGNGLDVLSKTPQAAEMLLRILNNVAPVQGATF